MRGPRLFWLGVGLWGLLMGPLHERAHQLAYRAFGVPASARLTITRIPKGFRGRLRPAQKAIVALAGPGSHAVLGWLGVRLWRMGGDWAGVWAALAVVAPLARLGNYLLRGLGISFRSGKRRASREWRDDEDLAAQALGTPARRIRLPFALLFGATIARAWEGIPGRRWARLTTLASVLLLYGLLARGVLALDQRLFPEHHARESAVFENEF